MLQYSFVAGLLSREMDGRSDLEQYQKGAADIVNFVPRRTGGLRKRAGTQFVARVAADAAPRAWRVFPYTFDRNECGAVVLWMTVAGALMSRFMRLDGGTGAPAEAAAVADGWSADDLENCKCLQAGDTLFLTRAGRRTLRCKVEFSSIDALSWSKMPERVDVAATPAMSAAAAGFGSGTGYSAHSQMYCVVAVKDGVMSAMRTASASITLPWAQNAAVSLGFTPNWAAADYYLVGKKIAASYVLIGTVYPETESSAPAPTARAALSGVGTSGTFADNQYFTLPGYAANGTQNYPEVWTTSNEFVAAIPAQWSPVAFNPNQTTAIGRHSHGIFFRNGVVVNFTVSGKIRRIEHYRGFIQANYGESVSMAEGNSLHWLRANNNHTLHLEVNVSGTWQSLGSQTCSGDFTTGASVWNIADYTQTQTQYRIRWVCSNASAPLPTRGFIVFTQATSTGAFSLVDNNLTATSAILPQDSLTVGDAGMDADIAFVHEQRLGFAASWQRPFSAWFSSLGNLNSFAAGRPQAAGDAFMISIPATTASRILHAFSGRALVLFTESGEYVAGSGDAGFGFQSVQVRRVSTVGIHPAVAPCESGGVLAFAGADGRSLFCMRYDLASDGMIGVDLSVFARDVFEGKKIKRLAYQQFPDSVVWCLLDDGSLASMTFMPEQNVLAWARHEFAPAAGMRLVDILSPQSVVEAAGCETSSVVFLVWEREGEPEALYIERMRPQVASDVVDAATAECADHVGYEGQGIGNGEWGMEAKRNVVAELRTLRPEHPQFQSMGATKNVLGVTVRLRRSGRVKIRPAEGWSADGTEPRELEWVEEGLADGDAGDPIRLFSGDVKILPRSLQSAEGAFVLRSDDGLPCEAQSVVFRLQYDGG